jgi:hypothetical protein
MFGTSSFSKVSGPVKGVALIGTGAGVGTILMHFVSWNRQLMFMLLMGIAFIAMLAIVYRQISKSVRKRKSQKFEAELAGEGQAAGRRQDLSDRFREGIQQLRDAKVDVYNLPWYVVVGESGSGKTEAIRNSRLQFPLNDQMQGTGGTADMHWWITDEAVLLDTAGRLFLHEEGDQLSQNQWSDFLKLLRHTRPTCPITGMLLVVPADKLISAPAEDLARKARDTAEQLRQVQKALDVRFPVFVVITKADLVTGFREYFDSLDDIDLQHQMIGWSNPDDLDTPFDPRKLDDLLAPLIQRVRDKRRELLQDPRPQREAGRLAEVDALYDFPASLGKLVPRLRHYLESVFAGTNLTAKPLFCRGVYLTSSLSQGAALDEELAQAMGMPVEQLPGGGAFREDRSYFLRDMFRDKVFRERGLVTQATNARKLYRRRKTLVFGSCFLAIGALLALTAWAGRQFERSIGSLAMVWKASSTKKAWSDELYFRARSEDGSRELVPKYLEPPLRLTEAPGSPYEYNGTLAFDTDGDDDREPLATLLRRLHAMADHEIRIPWVFSWIPMGDDALRKLRARDMLIVRDAALVAPLFDATRDTLFRAGGTGTAENPPRPWDVKGEAVLGILLEVELRELGLAAYCEGKDEVGEYPFEALMDFAVSQSGGDGGERMVEWTLAKGTGEDDSLMEAVRAFMEADTEWPGRVALGVEVAEGKLAYNRPLQVSLERFVAHYADPANLWTAAPDVAAASPVQQWEVLARKLREVQSKQLQAETAIASARTQHQTLIALVGEKPFRDVVWDDPATLCGVMLDEAKSLANDWQTNQQQVGVAVAAANKAVTELRKSSEELVEARKAMPTSVAWDSASFLAAFEAWLEHELKADARNNPLFASIPPLSRFMAAELSEEAPAEAREFQDWLRNLAKGRLADTRKKLLEAMRQKLEADQSAIVAAAQDGMWQRAVDAGAGVGKLVDPHPAALAEQEAALKTAKLAILAADDAPEARLTELQALLKDGAASVKATAAPAMTVVAVEDGRRNTVSLRAAQGEFPSSVGKLQDWGLAKAKPRPRELPALPFTGLADVKAETDYAPAVAQAIVANVRPSLGSRKGRFVECDALAGGQDAIRETFEGYLNDYSEYWLDLYDTGHRCSSAGNWAETKEAVGGIRLRDVKDFTEMFGPAFEALNDARGLLQEGEAPKAPAGEEKVVSFLTEDEQAVQLEAKITHSLLSSRDYRDWEDDADDALRNWRRVVRRNPGAARRDILTLTPGDFEKAYGLPRTPRDFRDPHYFGRYWRNWAGESLGSLADASQQEIGQQIRDLRGKYDKFPLAPPQPGVASLSLDGCKEARGAIERALGQLRSAPKEDERNGFPAGSIGSGAEGDLAGAVKAALRKLKDAGTVRPADMAWLEQNLVLLDAILSADCTFDLPLARLSDNPDPAFEAWFVFRLSAGEPKPWLNYRLDGRKGFKYTLPVGAAALALEFNQRGDLDENHPHYRLARIPQEWSPLRLLYGGDNGQQGVKQIRWSTKHEPITKRWVLNVDLLTPDNHGKRAVLYLRFEKELPAWFREQIQKNQPKAGALDGNE